MTMPATAPLRIVAVAAGLSSPSSTRLLADRLAEATREALESGQDRRVEVEVVELRDLAVDIANHLVTGFPCGRPEEGDRRGDRGGRPDRGDARVHRLVQRAVQVVLRPGREHRPDRQARRRRGDRRDPRHSLVLEHAMRPLFAYLRAVVLPTSVYAASEDWGSHGDEYTEGLPSRIRRAGGELASAVTGRAVSGASRALTVDDGEDAVVPFAQQLAGLRVG